MKIDPVHQPTIPRIRQWLSAAAISLVAAGSLTAQSTTTQDTTVEFTTYEAWRWIQPAFSGTAGPRMNVRADREVDQTSATAAVLSKAANQIVLVDGQVVGGIGTGFDDDGDTYSNEQEWAAEDLYDLWGGWYAAWPGDVPPAPEVPAYAGANRGLLAELYGDAVDIDRDGYSDALEEAAALAALLPINYYSWWGNRNPGGERDVVWTTLADGRSWPFSITNVTPARIVRPYSGGFVRIIGAPTGSTIRRPQSMVDYSTQFYARNATTGTIDINNMSVYHWGKKYPDAASALTAETDLLPGVYSVDYRSIQNPFQTAVSNVQAYTIPNGALTIGAKRPSWLLRSVSTIGKLNEPPTQRPWVNGRIEFDPDLENILTWDNLAGNNLANPNTDTLTLTVVDANGARLWPSPEDYPTTESINLSLVDPKLSVSFGKLYGIPGRNGLPTSILRRDATLVFRYTRAWRLGTTADWSTVTLRVPVRFVQTYESWRKTMFFGANLTNDAVSGPTGDPDQDGFTNQQEFDNGTNPLVIEYRFKLQLDPVRAVTPTSATLAATIFNDTKILPVTVTEWGFVYAKQSENPLPSIGGAFSFSIPKASSLTTDRTTFLPNAITYVDTKGETVRPPYPASLVGAFDLNITNAETAVTTDPVSTPALTYPTPLDPNTTYVYRAYAFTDADGLVYSDTTGVFTTPPASLPVVNNPFGEVTLVGTALTLNAGGTSVSDGGAAIIEQGIVYADVTRNDVPTIGGNDTTRRAATTTDLGQFTLTLTANATNNLVAGRTYAFRAYATNEVGTAYSDIIGRFTVPAPLAVTTMPSANVVVGASHATAGGDVVSSGGATIVERGVVYSTTSTTPTVATTAPTATSGTIRAPQNLTGPFTVFINNLTPGTTYNYRAFVRSSLGTAYTYGTSLQFRTISTVPFLSTPTLVTSTGTGATWRCSTIRVNDGGTISRRGMVYALSSDPVPTIGSTGAIVRDATPISGTTSFDIAVTGLQPATEYRVRAFAVNSIGTGYSESLVFRTPSAPILGALTINQLRGDSVNLGASILFPTAANLSDIQRRGIVYSLVSANPDPLLNGASVTDVPATFVSIEQFVSSLTGLQPNQTYCFKAYAQNATGIGYSTIGVFTTLSLPQTSPPSVSSLAANSVSASSMITSSGDSTVTEVGFVLSPTATNNSPTIGGTGVIRVSAPLAVNAFSSTLASLQQATAYTIRSYAINAEGTGYSSSVAFTTLTAPSLTTPVVASIQATSATLGATVTSPGSQPITRTGVLAIPSSLSLSPTLTTTGVVRVDSTSTSTGPFTAAVAGLLPGTEYSFCGFAITDAGVGYSPVAVFRTAGFAEVSSPSIADVTSTSVLLGMTLLNNGGEAVTEIGILYSLTSVNSTPVIGGPGVTSLTAFAMPAVGPTYFARINNLLPSSAYTVRAYAINSAGVALSSPWSFTTAVTNFPTVASFFSGSSYDADAATSAIILGGNVISDGGSPLTARGVVYAPTTSNIIPAVGVAGSTNVAAAQATTGHFSLNVTGLDPGVTYVFRAYASNASGTGYSPILRFIAASPPPAAASIPLLVAGDASVSWVAPLPPAGSVRPMSTSGTARVPQFVYQVGEDQSGMLGNCVIEWSENASQWNPLAEQNWQVDSTPTYMRAIWKVGSGSPPERAFFRVRVSTESQ